MARKSCEMKEHYYIEAVGKINRIVDRESMSCEESHAFLLSINDIQIYIFYDAHSPITFCISDVHTLNKLRLL